MEFVPSVRVRSMAVAGYSAEAATHGSAVNRPPATAIDRAYTCIMEPHQYREFTRKGDHWM
jgi:hypothetical protein